MAWFKRIFFFALLNMVIVITISLVMRLLGVEPYLTAYGLNYESLAVFCLVWGMGGAFISLALSRIMAKWMMGVKVIDENVRDPGLQSLVQRVHRLAKGAGLSRMPQVGIYESPDINAFATGPMKSRSLVAVSTGLLRQMDSAECEGVLAHEVAHIANGDMVTMTLIQGVVNAFVMFMARVAAFAVSQALRSDREDDRGGAADWTYIICQIVFEIAFMILGSMVVAWFSRHREYRADRGGAQYAGREKMIGALEALRRNYGVVESQGGGQGGAAQMLKISSRGSGIFRLFSTHPPLEDRIARLKSYS